MDCLLTSFVHTFPSTCDRPGMTIDCWDASLFISGGMRKIRNVRVLTSNFTRPVWNIAASHRLPSLSASRASEPKGAPGLMTG